jgi:NAD+ synthase
VIELPRVDPGLLAAALEKFLAEELRASGLAGYVIGLSGGVDSAVSAALAAGAVGQERLVAIALPGPTSSPESLRDAQAVAKALGIALEEIKIGPAAEALAGVLGCRDDRLRFGNLLARLRMATLFDRARTVPGLVLGTSNKSEVLLGYSTLFGDAAASVHPLGDVWKTDVFALARHLGVPQAVIAKPPTADLWPGQTDAGELGFEYPTVDPVLYAHHERGVGREALIVSGFPDTLVDAALTAYRRNRFKWRPSVLARTSASCINIDRILPRNPER